MKSVIPLPVWQIKETSKQLRTSFGEDYVAYKRLQSEVADVDRYFGHEIWGPSGLSLARSAALEAAGEDLARTFATTSQVGPSTRAMGQGTDTGAGADGLSNWPTTKAAPEEEAPRTTSPSSRPQV